MADPPKNTPTFSFGPATPSSGSGGTFGQTASSAPQPAGLFGSAAAPPATSGGGLFGSGSTTAAPSGSLFGSNAKPSQPASAFGGGSNGSNLFGSANKPATGGGFSFGQATSNSASSGGLFGSSQPISQAGQPTTNVSSVSLFSTPSKSTETPATTQAAPNLFGGAQPGGGGLFGNLGNTTPTSKQTSSLFSNSTTPAGPPPGSSMGAGSGSLFGLPKTADSQSNTVSNPAPAKSTATSLFGQTSTANSDSNKPPSAAATTQLSNIFGDTTSNANSGSSPFGKPVATSQPQQGGLFQNLSKPQDNGAGKPAEQQPQTQNKSTASLFQNLGGQSSSDAASTKTPSTPSVFGNTTNQPSFGFPKASEAPASSGGAASASATAPAASQFGNVTSSSGTPVPPTTVPKTSFFPSLSQPQGKASANTTGTSAPSAPSTASNMFGGLGKPSAPAATSQPQIQTTAAPADASKSTANLGASTAGPAPPARSRLKDKTMDDIITRWASDLSKYQKEFQTQAEKVAQWDRMLVENSEKIQRLYGSTLEAERATTEVERQLTSVESDQAELESWLNHYEAEVDSMIQTQVGQGEGFSGPDQERERTYQLATKLSDRLDSMGKDLGSMIEEINDASSNLSKHTKADDPLTQVVRVLNNHLTQLQQIDQGATTLQLKVKEAQKAGQILGPPSGLGGPSSDAAEGFYRSYMGRG